MWKGLGEGSPRKEPWGKERDWDFQGLLSPPQRKSWEAGKRT